MRAIAIHASRAQVFVRLVVIAVLAAVLAVVVPVHSMVKAAADSDRQRMFAAAAQEFGVPEELLLSISYNQSRWETHSGQPSVSGGYGLMHLTEATVTPEDGRGDPAWPIKPRVQSAERDQSLAIAADALKVSAQELKKSDRQNIRGGAAVLARFAREANSGQLPTSVNDWYAAVARMSGAVNAAAAQGFADDVYATIQTGAALTTADGQKLALAPKAVQPNHAGLEALKLPQPLAAPSDIPQPECPRTLTCHFVPARFAQNDPADPANYGNYDQANRPRDIKIKYIIIHDTEGSYQSAISWFQDPASFVAAHYVIRSSDGDVTQMVRTQDVGWHAGNWYMNMHSIGIEHEGFAALGGLWYTEAMYKSSAKLVRYLSNKYGIPLDRQHILGHDQVPGINPARTPLMHYDPGPFWDWNHYMDLLHGRGDHSGHSRMQHASPLHFGGQSKVVKIAPDFAHSQPPVQACLDADDCLDLPRQGSNFVYLRTAPREDAPLLSDAGLHPDGAPGTTMITDWGARATAGQQFVVAERQGDWTAIWFSGQKAWFHNPASWNDRTAQPSSARTVTPKAGKASIPVYGRPVPEASAFIGGTKPFSAVPLQYTIAAGQAYTAPDPSVPNDYYQVLTFDRSAPGDGVVVIGNERYIPIEFNHREAFVKASDVNLRWW